MIKLKSGFYGSRNLLIRPEDGPFSLPKAEEERLVKRGVAEYVQGKEAVNPFEGLKTPELRAIAKANGLTFRFGMTNAEMAAYLQTHKAKFVKPAEEEKGDDAPAGTGDTVTDPTPDPDPVDEEGEEDEGNDAPAGEDAPTFDAAEAVK